MHFLDLIEWLWKNYNVHNKLHHSPIKKYEYRNSVTFNHCEVKLAHIINLEAKSLNEIKHNNLQLLCLFKMVMEVNI